MVNTFSHLLQEERAELRGRLLSVCLVGKVDFPGHTGVTVVIHPPRGASLDDRGMLNACELKAMELVAGLDSLLSSAVSQVQRLFADYFPESANTPPSDLISNLKLTHVKLMFDQGDELILYGNKNYLNFDLNLRIGKDGGIEEAWFDG